MRHPLFFLYCFDLLGFQRLFPFQTTSSVDFQLLVFSFRLFYLDIPIHSGIHITKRLNWWIFYFSFKYTAFAISGSTLIQRIRSKTFACLLRQEIAYFDHPENSSGAITARLSSEASAIQKIMSLQLGAICESFSLTFVSLSLGLLFSWQLTIIIFIALVLFIFFSYLHVRFTMGHCQKTGFILEQASSVGSYCCRKLFDLKKLNTSILSCFLQLAVQVIHNMRTVKQLSVEKEVLQQYSQSIDQVYK